MFHDSQNEPKVITLPELLVMLFLSLSLMVLFFPKNSIQEAIESEKSNYDLTLIYLKSIAQAYPDDPHNWFQLMDAQLKMGRLQEAEKTFEKVQRFDTIDRSRLAVMGYRLIKIRYLKSGDAMQKKQLFSMLRQKLQTFIQSNDPSLWLTAAREAKALHLHRLRYDALKKRLIHFSIVDSDELREIFRLGQKLGRKQESIALLEALIQKRADMEIARILKSYYLSQSDYLHTARLCRMLFEQFGKQDCFFEAVKYAFFANQHKDALQLLEKHRMAFVDNPVTSEKIIRLYLANGYVQKAREYTLLLLRKEGVLQ